MYSRKKEFLVASKEIGQKVYADEVSVWSCLVKTAGQYHNIKYVKCGTVQICTHGIR